MTNIDIDFDFRTDTPQGGDPDALSPTLRKYHQLLWSKPLPSGKFFDLSPVNGKYLYHKSELGEFIMSSDSVVPSYIKWKRMQPLLNQIPDGLGESFRAKGYTIGGMMIWVASPQNGQKTINVARGFNQYIADRMDLTLECIRRYYIDQESPLHLTISAYSNYFSLFESFEGFVNFFLLQDLVIDDYTEIKFFTDFDNFKSTGVPKDKETYIEYRRRSIDWIEARNNRIAEYSKSN